MQKPDRARAKTRRQPKGQQPAPVKPALSLDDAAALLIQADLSDLDVLERACQALADLASQESSPAAVRRLLAAAAARLAAITRRGVSDPAATLTEANQLIEAAMSVIDGVGDPERPTPMPSGKHVPMPAAAESRRPTPAPTESAAGRAESEAEHVMSLPPDTDLDLLRDFIAESREYIEKAEAALLALENDPTDSEAINTVFRAFHTIKGTSAFLGLDAITHFAHHAESLLDQVRDHKIPYTGPCADLALRSADMLKALLTAVHNALSGAPLAQPSGYDELLGLLTTVEAAELSVEPDSLAPSRTDADKSLRLGDILVVEGKATREAVEAAAATATLPLGVALVQSGSASVTDVAQALRQQQRGGTEHSAAESSVRVRTDRLDRLVDMVGELVIAQSMIAGDEIVLRGGHVDLARKVGHAGKIVRELQDLSMSMRMVPLKATFQKLARLVRDVAQKTGKQVEFVAEGEDTEIDRNMVDVIADPLVHMVRNAIDHGIEPPAARAASGKPRTGVVRLSAYHAGGNVVVELQDDGKGLDRERIIQKAVAKGLVESDKGFSDSQVFSLIFMPGFSTAETVTDVSGRGVGMDVVKRNVEALRGRIDIASEAGRGSTFSVRLPLTLAITDGMLVQVGPERYIVPTINIQLSFRPEPSTLSTVAGRGEMVLLRGELMPVVRLSRLFGIAGAIEDPTRALLMIVGDGANRSALLVDELLGQQQVVAKTLGDGISKMPGISGGAILGDGRVGLILDIAEIVALVRQDGGTNDGRGTLHKSVA